MRTTACGAGRRTAKPAKRGRCTAMRRNFRVGLVMSMWLAFSIGAIGLLANTRATEDLRLSQVLSETEAHHLRGAGAYLPCRRYEFIMMCGNHAPQNCTDGHTPPYCAGGGVHCPNSSLPDNANVVCQGSLAGMTECSDWIIPGGCGFACVVRSCVQDNAGCKCECELHEEPQPLRQLDAMLFGDDCACG